MSTTTITMPTPMPDEQTPLISKQEHPITWSQIIGAGIGLCVGMTSTFLTFKPAAIADASTPIKILLPMIVPITTTITTTITGTIIGGLLNNCWSWNKSDIDATNNQLSVTSTQSNPLTIYSYKLV